MNQLGIGAFRKEFLLFSQAAHNVFVGPADDVGAIVHEKKPHGKKVDDHIQEIFALLEIPPHAVFPCQILKNAQNSLVRVFRIHAKKPAMNVEAPVPLPQGKVSLELPSSDLDIPGKNFVKDLVFHEGKEVRGTYLLS